MPRSCSSPTLWPGPNGTGTVLPEWTRIPIRGHAPAAGAVPTAPRWPFSSPANHAHHLQAFVRVAPFVLVPAHHFHEGFVQRDAGVGVEHGGAGVAARGGGAHLVLGAAEHAFARTLGLGLQVALYGVVAGGPGQFHRQV